MKTRWISYFTVAAIAFLLGMSYADLVPQNHSAQQNIPAVIWDMAMEHRIEEMAASSQNITRNKKLAHALRKGDLALIAEASSCVFNRLASEKITTSLALYDMDLERLTVFPKEATLPETTLLEEAFNSRKAHYGFLKHGNDILIAYAFPVYARGKLKGIAIFLSDLSVPISNVEKRLGSPITVTLTPQSESDIILKDPAGQILAGLALSIKD